MENLRSVLLDHVGRYPLMEPTDAVKLIYQNEFGGGHLIRDAQQCLARLRAEYQNTPQSSSGIFAESIGNGLVRVHLGCLDAQGYTPEQLGNAFIRSAAEIRGNPDSFRNKLELLRELAAQELLPFSAASLEDYLQEYEKAGFPMVSHSSTYRDVYHPAYRIVKETQLHETGAV